MAVDLGYNAGLITSSLNKLNSSWGKVNNTLTSQIQSSVINELVQSTATPELKKCIASFADVTNEFQRNALATFESVNSSINSAGASWAAATQGDPVSVGFSGESGSTDGSAAREATADGTQGVDKVQAMNTLSAFPRLREAFSQAMNEAENSVDTASFVGSNQIENLKNSLSTIRQNGTQYFDDLMNQAENAIKESLEKYGDTGTKCAESFTIQ